MNTHTHDASQRESPPTHSAGSGLLAGEEMSWHPAVLPVPHAQRPHGGSDLHLEQQTHILLTDHRHSAQTQAAGEGPTVVSSL